MVATAADGDVDTRRLADISTPSAKPLTTSLPPSTGEQTHPLRRKQTLGAYECLKLESAMLGGRLKGTRAAGLYEPPCVFFFFNICKSVRRLGETITLHPLPEAINCFQREEKTAHSSCDVGERRRQVTMAT